jgi:hypothetical protein
LLLSRFLQHRRKKLIYVHKSDNISLPSELKAKDII